MSTTISFKQLLLNREQHAQSLICVGLDPVMTKLPSSLPQTAEGVAEFCLAIIDSTKDLVSSYKPNLPFYLSLGSEGLSVLRRIREAIPSDIPMILDCKVNDLGDTAQAWVRTIFDYLEADAVTVAPYMGEDALAPYFSREGKGVIVLVKTSNPGSGDFQDLTLASGQELYRHVAESCRIWDATYPADIGMVVGATYPEQLEAIRASNPEQIILLPGLGAQGGDIERSVRAGVMANGGGLICSSSRSILYASSGDDFAAAARSATIKLRDEINRVRPAIAS